MFPSRRELELDLRRKWVVPANALFRDLLFHLLHKADHRGLQAGHMLDIEEVVLFTTVDLAEGRHRHKPHLSLNALIAADPTGGNVDDSLEHAITVESKGIISITVPGGMNWPKQLLSRQFRLPVLVEPGQVLAEAEAEAGVVDRGMCHRHQRRPEFML